MLLSFIKTYFRSSRKKKYIGEQFVRPESPSFLKNNNGQAIVEYILLVVVMLTIAYGLGRHFFSPLQKYGSAVFTSTIACALEYGQLPADITTEEGCSASLQATAMAGGSGGSGGGGTGGKGKGGKGGGSANDPDSKNKGGDRNKEASNKSENGGSGGGANAPGDGTSSSSSGGGGRSGSPSSITSRKGTLVLKSSGGSEGGRRTPTEISVESGGGGFGEADYSVGGRFARKRKPIYKQIRGELVEEIALRKKKEKVVDVNAGRSVAGAGGDSEGKPKRLMVNTKREKKAAEVQQQNWDMSKILRIALIVLMVVAILLFIFFQVSQIRKGAGSA